MSQPKWKMIANLGDKHPFDYGGLFVFIDETGVYQPEAVLLMVENEYEVDEQEDLYTYTAHRFILERCTFINGILSDNKFHPDHAAWWAKPEEERAERPQDTTYLKNLADRNNMTVNQLAALFCSEDPLARADAYRMVGEYHGYANLDENPVTGMTRMEAEEKYKEYKRLK